MEQRPPSAPLLNLHPAPHRPIHTADPNEPPRKKHRWVWIILLAIFAVAIYLIWQHKPNVSQQEKGGGGRHSGGTVTINAATAGKGEMAVKLEAIGTVTATYTANITAQVSGQIIAVHYHEGQNVRKGDPLIDIDPRPYQATLDTDEGTLAKDQGTLAQAQMDLQRYKDAWARNAIAKQTLDDQEKIVDQDLGAVKSDEGAVEAAKVNLVYCHIIAPVNGRVGLRLVDPGNIVTANGTTTLVVVAQVEPITVVYTIPEDNLPQVQDALHHKRLKTEVYDRSDEKMLGVSTQQTLDNQVDASTGTVKLRATFPNKDGKLFPNQFVNTKLQTDVLQNQIMIPTSAIQFNGQQAFVYKIVNNVAQIVNVKMGQADNSMTEVTGINEGDQVANSSFERLQNKSKVRIVKQKIGTTSAESDAP